MCLLILRLDYYKVHLSSPKSDFANFRVKITLYDDVVPFSMY